MKEFEFVGDWKFDLALPILSKINSEEWFGNSKHNAKLESGLVPVEISDHYNDDPDPSSDQMATINYIIQNEGLIIKTLVESINGKINNLYHEACGDEDWIKPVHDQNDLGIMLGLGEIRILHESKKGYAYYALFCEYTGDHEHGLTLTLYKDELIGFEGSCEVDYDGIVRHIDGSPQCNWPSHDQNIKKEIHKAHPKYGKLKPWQDENNSDFCYALIKAGENQRIKDEINSGKLNIHQRFEYSGKNLLDMACGTKNYELIDYFLEKGVSTQKSISSSVGGTIDKTILMKLNKAGANINSFDARNLSPFLIEIKGYVSALMRLEDARGKNNYQYKNSLEQTIKAEANLPIYLELGVDPSNCTSDNKDYKSELLKSWNKNYLDRYRIFEKIDALLYPPKNPVWKFWS